MLVRTSTLRRALLLAQQRAKVNQQQAWKNRSFHCTSVSAQDALDMVDTFPRRHCKSIFELEKRWSNFEFFFLTALPLFCVSGTK